MKNKTSQNISILRIFPILAWMKFCLAFLNFYTFSFFFLEKEILVALLFMNRKVKQKKKTKYLVEQTPARFVMEKKVLLSRLKHVQLYHLAELHKRKKYFDKSLHRTKCLWTDSTHPWFVKMLQKIILQLILILGFSWPHAYMIS